MIAAEAAAAAFGLPRASSGGELARAEIEKAVNSVSITAANEKRLPDENQQALVAA